VQRGVGEDGIDRHLNHEVFSPGDLESEVWVELASAGDHLLRRVDPHNLSTGRGDLRRQRAGPAAEVDDPFPWPRREQLDDTGA
jgi:hypothetical protein